MSLRLVISAIGVIGLTASSYIIGHSKGSRYKRIIANHREMDVVMPRPPQDIVIWGMPGAGKTTFIQRLLGEEPSDKPQQTSSKREFKDIKAFKVDEKQVQINKLIDLPGTYDRLDDWKELVRTHDNLYYLIDLDCLIRDKIFFEKNKKIITETVEYIVKTSEDNIKKLNIIYTHSDKTKLQNFERANRRDKLDMLTQVSVIYNLIKMKKIGTYSYVVNLLDEEDSEKLIKDIFRDLA